MAKLSRVRIGLGLAMGVGCIGAGTWGLAAIASTSDLNPLLRADSAGAAESNRPGDTDAVVATETKVASPSSSSKSAGRGTANLPREFYVRTKDKVFFITIDDGWTKSAAALDYVRKNRLPVTVFLTNTAFQGEVQYFKDITAYGGSVENHTMAHPSLPRASNLRREICTPQRIYKRKFGAAPTLIRPPYGNGGYDDDSVAVRSRISRVASSCGLRHIVMWNAVAQNGKVQFDLKRSIRRGDVILFHFTPSLAGDLRKVLRMARDKGLRAAPLTDYLK